jgi:hypothetical protein
MNVRQSNYSKTDIAVFTKKLQQVNIASLQMAPYCKRYLQHLQENATYYCTIYQQIFDTLLNNTNQKKETIHLIDYGAGNGLMGIFAKYFGFKKVFINDINPSFITAAKALATNLSIDIDGFIKGDIDEVAIFFKIEKPHAIISFDVVEHIYNLTTFLNALHIINPKIISVFGTGVNAQNPIKNNYFKQLQIKDELKGGMPTDFALYGSTATPPFIDIRRLIIKNTAANLSIDEVNLLAIHTRGLHKADIEIATTTFVQNKKIPTLLTHPTNTCDPLTGSWTERILTLNQYRTIYASAGFKLFIENGFYNQYNPSLKSKLMIIANFFVKLFGVKVAPYILLVGKN